MNAKEIANAIAALQALAAANDITQALPPFSEIQIAELVDRLGRKGFSMSQVTRVDGPYLHGNKWRLRIHVSGNVRRYVSFDNSNEAKRAKDALELRAARDGSPTVMELVRRYELHLQQSGNKPRGIETTVSRLRRFFASVLTERSLFVTQLIVKKLLNGLLAVSSRQGGTLSVDTRKNIFAEVKTFCKWSCDKGWFRDGLTEGLAVLGRRKKGKPQLRFDERERFFLVALDGATRGDEGAMVALLALDGGLRSSEAYSRMVRDVDRGGSVLWVEDAKTQAGNRQIELSPEVATALTRYTKGKKPTDQLFCDAARLKDPKTWVIRQVHRLCDEAKVPRVCPHALRGTEATKVVVQELVSHVSRKLGHTSTDVTLGHYIDPAVLAQITGVLRGLSRTQKPVPNRSQEEPSRDTSETPAA